MRSTPGKQPRRLAAFTLIELLTVIVIIAVLMTLLFSGIGWVRESARRVQARHDLQDMVTAVHAYDSEYGVYPVAPQPPGQATEVTFATSNSDLIYTLADLPEGANNGHILNPRHTVFISPPPAKNPSSPKNGLANGNWYDPWGPQPGKPESGIYHIRIDATYNDTVSDPYPGDSGASKWNSSGAETAVATIHAGVIAWSLASTGVQTYELEDQVLSWK